MSGVDRLGPFSDLIADLRAKLERLELPKAAAESTVADLGRIYNTEAVIRRLLELVLQTADIVLDKPSTSNAEIVVATQVQFEELLSLRETL